MDYNGDLRKLYYDLDKRFGIMEGKDDERWSHHDKGAEEHRAYVHKKFHDVMERLVSIENKLTELPCKERNERNKWIDVQLKAIWWIVSVGVIGIISNFISNLFKTS